MQIDTIIEFDEAAEYILSRGLLSQYKKAKAYILGGFLSSVDFKICEPKNKGIYQFRINRKYRGYCYFSDDGHTLIIYKISDHQE